MDHPEAIRLMATEKYLLNELSPELRRSFEEHFFECPECEFDVQAGCALIDGAKDALSSKAIEVEKNLVPGKPNQWLSWLRPAIAVPIMAVLLVIVGWQNLVTVPKLKSAVAVAQAPQILNPLYLTADATRDSTPVVTTKRNQPFSLALDIHTDNRFASYVCELQSPSGELDSSLPISADAAKNAVNVSMYPRSGNAGTYQIVIYGVPQDATGQKVAIAHQSLELRIQD